SEPRWHRPRPGWGSSWKRKRSKGASRVAGQARDRPARIRPRRRGGTGRAPSRQTSLCVGTCGYNETPCSMRRGTNEGDEGRRGKGETRPAWAGVRCTIAWMGGNGETETSEPRNAIFRAELFKSAALTELAATNTIHHTSTHSSTG